MVFGVSKLLRVFLCVVVMIVWLKANTGKCESTTQSLANDLHDLHFD